MSFGTIFGSGLSVGPAHKIQPSAASGVASPPGVVDPDVNEISELSDPGRGGAPGGSRPGIGGRVGSGPTDLVRPFSLRCSPMFGKFNLRSGSRRGACLSSTTGKGRGHCRSGGTVAEDGPGLAVLAGGTEGRGPGLAVTAWTLSVRSCVGGSIVGGTVVAAAAGTNGESRMACPDCPAASAGGSAAGEDPPEPGSLSVFTSTSSVTRFNETRRSRDRPRR